jgi:hypothetical protein
LSNRENSSGARVKLAERQASLARLTRHRLFQQIPEADPLLNGFETTPTPVESAHKNRQGR